MRNVPLEFDFLFSKSHAEVISGKQEGRSFLKTLLHSLQCVAVMTLSVLYRGLCLDWHQLCPGSV